MVKVLIFTVLRIILIDRGVEVENGFLFHDRLSECDAMDEYELSLDNISFFDAQIVGGAGKEFIASIVWLHNFQWSSWTKGVDGPEVLIEQWNNSDAIVSFDEEEIVMSLIKEQFGLSYDNYINLIDYCDNHIKDVAREIGVEYPGEIDMFQKSQSTNLWVAYIQGHPSALTALLYYSAWYTDLIYHIFFKVCGDVIPLRIFIPWKLEVETRTKKIRDSKVENKALYEKLMDAYDFSSPSAAIDE